MDDPGVLTRAVGVPNLLGGLVALAATDTLGRRRTSWYRSAVWRVARVARALERAHARRGCGVVLRGARARGDERFAVRHVRHLAAICSDLPSPELGGAVRQLEPLRTVALVTIPAYTLFSSLGAGPVPWLLYNEVFPTRIRARATAVHGDQLRRQHRRRRVVFTPRRGDGTQGNVRAVRRVVRHGFVFVNTFVFETKGWRSRTSRGSWPSARARCRGTPVESERRRRRTHGTTIRRAAKTIRGKRRENQTSAKGGGASRAKKMRAGGARESSVDEGAGTDDEKNAEKRR